MEKKQSRLKRAKRTRKKILVLGSPRLSVHRTPQHIYAQLIVMEASAEDPRVKIQKIIASVSTLDKTLRSSLKTGGNVTAATKVGELIAERVKAKGITKVAFDRSGYKYHGRIKALAEAARAGGLEF
ncbi:MAG: 50S ribosomal protein L18 [uncultured bacterium]|nr:MAG: 50S ribosomal protein L18 [uncultured bacterium]OGT16842.1 MAG: 50S ribosomal protein L18 [Gammaproteobacteria bacterium RIFCSPHIGHO2_02_FULL_38_33]OGT23912.1 MAG: 50S ribosomal protein L18 [Gammaproteobacteria bacterium RIFCSPHIGHO2_12_38_15]OGT67120.1 MAG: 50S ribosomal protein L18 [Gammaproteobacteria bacterium RIFCSPLOWO2_02_FULL_38_11]OGT76115.1 MAG: 50S ribosomal protein L18 [Gammaproteobacteria bacterium RIFCSPLOWO2_12_FULL_38_14]